jgi:TolB-like protein/DNA-binding winged helix-turn-helix (wHTH) protein/Tfp pilus assembly protein PilF
VTPAGTDVRILRFGAFELDLRQDELRRSGLLIKLTPQQLRVLRYLAERADEVATREEIRQEIWGGEVFVDFDRSLNVCIAQIRAALNDDPEAARFIQTAPRRGYRFVAPVVPVKDVTPVIPERGRLPVGRMAAAGAAVVALTAAAWMWTSKTPPARAVLAILPFDNVTQHAADAPTIDGLADELITQFGAAAPERLAVIGRTSVSRLAAQKAPVSEIGRATAATYVLEGDWRSEGSRVRISARLLKVADQAQVWTDTYDLENAGALEMQEEVAARATAGAMAALFPQSARPARAHVPPADAYQALVDGRYLMHKRTRTDVERAVETFELAGSRDAKWAEPWASVAEAQVMMALSGAGAPEYRLERARRAAERALNLDGSNAAAHNALGDVLLWRDWKFRDAERQFTRALALNPSFAPARHDYAMCLILTGHAAAGVAELRRAIALDPLSPRVNVDAGWLLLQAHRFDQAIAAATRALELEPGMAEASACIARAQFYRGKMTEESLQFYRAREASANPYERALALAVLGRKPEAVAALRESFARRQILMVMVGTEPAFSGLQSDAGYREIVAGVVPR